MSKIVMIEKMLMQLLGKGLLRACSFSVFLLKTSVMHVCGCFEQGIYVYNNRNPFSGNTSVIARRGFARLASLSALLLLVGVFFLFYFYRTPIKLFARESVENYGYPALFIFCWFADALIQPVPPDVVVFGTAFGGANIWKTAFVAGAASAVGGTTGYLLGKIFGPWRFRRFFGSRLLRVGRDLFRDHGSLAIFVAGVSPVPYSAVCWIGGIYKMPLAKVILTSLVSRIPRFVAVAWLADLV
jgi:membrane protein YqaA with SNARE-associated domain